MTDVKKTTITVDSKEYLYEDLPPNQQALIQHLVDLGAKIAAEQKLIEQYRESHDSFLTKLRLAIQIADGLSDVVGDVIDAASDVAHVVKDAEVVPASKVIAAVAAPSLNSSKWPGNSTHLGELV